MLFLSIIYSTIINICSFEERSVSNDNLEESRTNIVWHWEDYFTSVERQKVERWLTSVATATEATIGVYPFDMHFHIYRRNGSREPVPWANTRRNLAQGVDFHIDPTYSLQSFLDDWTAPHEISHLSIPYLGRNHAWFAEGYASFMQYQIMERLGIYTTDQVLEKYSGKIDRVRHQYDRNQDFVTVARDLQSRNRHSDMYWGGASFFLRLDETLRREHNLTLPELMKEYLTCCRLADDSIEEVIASLDEILGGSICRELLISYQTEPASTLFELR